MFFFIAGVHPRTVETEEPPRMCPSCGRVQARLKRVDHYFSVFFVPLIRVKKGRPFLECRSCGGLSDESGQVPFRSQGATGPRCPSCGKPLESRFRFCPYCGREIS
ncbi:MAG: zinc ribbon domain-containing protein [Deltaproteobacteria bacterium]|nr:zinc ribbon domain-containing protein [Deltaproteobacteria bacterium]